MLSQGTYLQNRFRILRPLGKGGMGQVYEAEDEALECKVAIKQTFARTDELRRAFRREAKLLASLRHPVLPRVTNHFHEDDGQFLVMDYVDGDNLEVRLERRGIPFSVDDVIPVANQLLDSLEYLHGAKQCILHRDIKPANIKLAGDRRVFLLDFGLAKGSLDTFGLPGTGDLSVYGYTANYAPLEQITGAGTTPQSDLYALGATLYHLLTGKTPASASERYSQIELEAEDPLIPANLLNPRISPELSRFLQNALHMSRKHRYETATLMREELARLPISGSTAQLVALPTRQELQVVERLEVAVPKPVSSVLTKEETIPIPKPRFALPITTAKTFSGATTYISQLLTAGFAKTVIAPIQFQLTLVQDKLRISPLIGGISIIIAVLISAGLLTFVMMYTRTPSIQSDENKVFQQKAEIEQKTSDSSQIAVNATNLRNQGKRRESEREFNRAEEMMKRAIEIEPKNAKLHVSMAALYIAQKKWPEAIAKYELAVQLEPENRDYQTSLSRLKSGPK